MLLGGATHSQLVQLVDEFAYRRRHGAVSSSAVPHDADGTPSADRMLWHAVSACCSSTSVP